MIAYCFCSEKFNIDLEQFTKNIYLNIYMIKKKDQKI